MAQSPKSSDDPDAGRVVVIGAAALGLASVVIFGIGQVGERNRAREAAQQVEVGKRATSPSTADLIAQSKRARAELDTSTLSRMDNQLAAAAKTTSTAPKALQAQQERLAVLGTLAVESSMRASALGEAQAQQQALHYVAEGRALADQLGDSLDPGDAQAARARLALANNEDVLLQHPSVLLPTYRDRELQHAVLAKMEWTSAPAEGEDASGSLAQSLGQLSDPSGLERVLLAASLDAAGQHAKAQTIVDAVLTAIPDQPLARGLSERIRKEGLVAVSDAGPLSSADTLDPTADGPPAPVTPEPESVPEPVTPEPEPVPESVPEPVTPEPEPVPEPVTPEPEPAPTPASTDTGKPKSGTSKPKSGTGKPKSGTGKPKSSTSGSKRKTPAELTSEGCKLVRSGDASKGFAMLQKAFDLNPRDTKVTLCMAEGHMKLGRLPSARAMAERVLGKSPKNKKALLLAAKIEHKLGNKRSAVDYYRKVLEVDPGNSTAQNYVDKNG